MDADEYVDDDYDDFVVRFANFCKKLHSKYGIAVFISTVTGGITTEVHIPDGMSIKQYGKKTKRVASNE